MFSSLPLSKCAAVSLVIVIAAITDFAQINDATAAIRAEVNLINRNAPKYKKKIRSVEGISLEGTEAAYLSSGKDIRKITARIYGETFRAIDELYYKGGELIFAFQRLEHYDTHVAMDPPPKVVKVAETRVYYAKRKAIRVLEGKKYLALASAEFIEADESIMNLSKMLIAAAQ